MATASELELKVGEVVRRGIFATKVNYHNCNPSGIPDYVPVASGISCDDLISSGLMFEGPRMKVVNLDPLTMEYVDKTTIEYVEIHKPNGEIKREFRVVPVIGEGMTGVNPKYDGFSRLD